MAPQEITNCSFSPPFPLKWEIYHLLLACFDEIQIFVQLQYSYENIEIYDFYLWTWSFDSSLHFLVHPETFCPRTKILLRQSSQSPVHYKTLRIDLVGLYGALTTHPFRLNSVHTSDCRSSNLYKRRHYRICCNKCHYLSLVPWFPQISHVIFKFLPLILSLGCRKSVTPEY